MPSLWKQFLTPETTNNGSGKSINSATAVFITQNNCCSVLCSDESNLLPLKYYYLEAPEEAAVLGYYMLPSSAPTFASIPKQINSLVIVLDWKQPDKLLSSFFEAVSRLSDIDSLSIDLEAVFRHHQEVDLAKGIEAIPEFSKVKIDLDKGTLDRNSSVPLIVIVENVCPSYSSF